MMLYRLTSRRLKNSLRRKCSPQRFQLENTATTAQSLQKWLNLGYDKLNIGGGTKNLNGFINIDFVYSPNTQRQVVANILDLSFIPDSCIHHIHSNHVIEHLTCSDLKAQINQWYRILKADGLVTIRCPNALGAAYGFWFEPVIENQKEEFIKLGYPVDEDFGNPEDRWLHKDFFGLIHWLYGDAGNIANQHLCQITPTRLCELLSEANFQILKVTDPETLNIVVVARKVSLK